MKLPLTFKIETGHYVLRAPSEDDIPLIYSATRHKGFNDGMAWDPPKTEAELREPLKSGIAAWEKGEGYSFTIERKGAETLIGRISIRKTSEIDVWNVGFWTHPEYQRKGVMSEVLKRVLRLGFEKLSAKRIEACYAIWNKASEKVLKKNGLTFVAHIEKGLRKNGVWIEENRLAIRREDWKEKK